MANTEFPLIINEDDKQIEDVIDARKRSGQYDIYKTIEVFQNGRRPWSAPISALYEENGQGTADDVTMWLTEGNSCNYPDPGIFNIGPTDSEITVVRVKREGLRYKTKENKWNLHDEAVPGDGTHLGESPSLVNLVTLVGQSLHSYENKADQYHEYLVPLSSWDPSDNPYQLAEPDVQSTISTNTVRLTIEDDDVKTKYWNLKTLNIAAKHRGLAGKITNFLRKRCPKKSKTSVCDSQTKNGKSNEDVNINQKGSR